ncbi:NAD(P)-binding protein [Aaosphaeria arxii CBS 175.79]|uniref:NAD(P)-binding protein n=1 Tax=Aaosphaeria arxii CBS 175.79 TaxID=1450172 RepID=A0A6A5XNI1_9PLEO|nr:NAD(P)-binding protein [Aaosphaeria arxii CBS 175.79]KAF2014493.1 NAD(P)-binding protein [Aaosphaeria arxii CBS 175.79]
MSRFSYSTTGSEVVAAFAEQVTGKTFVITGASDGGLGAGVAVSLAAAHPATILLLGRTENKVAPVIDTIQKISPSTTVLFVEIDFASCASVRTAAAKVGDIVENIDALINNAGIMGAKFSLTPENVESQFGANHIGHFLLTNLLVSKQNAIGKGARVINVSSQLYQFSPVRFDDYNFSNGAVFNTWEAYGQSKTANILFSVALAKKLAERGVRSYSLHPGNIQATKLSSQIDPAEFPIVGQMIVDKKIAMPREKTIEQGTATTLAAALDPELDNASGAFLDDCNVATPLAYASSQENAEELWALSEKIVGQNFSY